MTKPSATQVPMVDGRNPNITLLAIAADAGQGLHKLQRYAERLEDLVIRLADLSGLAGLGTYLEVEELELLDDARYGRRCQLEAEERVRAAAAAAGESRQEDENAGELAEA